VNRRVFLIFASLIKRNNNVNWLLLMGHAYFGRQNLWCLALALNTTALWSI